MTQGLAFTLKERIALGIHGLQPPRFKTQEEQLALCKASVMKYTEDLNRYLYLVELQVSGASLFIAFKIVIATLTFLAKWFPGEEREIIFPSVERKHRTDDANCLYAHCRSGLPKVWRDLSQASRSFHYYIR